MYIGGGAGALALTGVAAASAYYLTSRPVPQRPLFPLDAQCLLEKEEDVSRCIFYFGFALSFDSLGISSTMYVLIVSVSDVAKCGLILKSLCIFFNDSLCSSILDDTDMLV